jgi:cytochrome c-type biogenesis protein
VFKREIFEAFDSQGRFFRNSLFLLISICFYLFQQGFFMSLHGNFFDLFIAFGAGVLVSFTPCVYPILPITAAAIAGANVQKTRLGGFFLSLIYVLGVALTYSALAVVASLTGKVFGTIQNSPWVMVAIANVFILFALIMFDIIPFPTLSLAGKTGKSKGAFSIFLTGVASGFIVGPCTAPVLGTLLLYVASQTNIVWGAFLILVFSFGLGTSLILAGTFSGFLTSLPKSGPWLERIKKFIGILFLVAAEFYLIKAGGLF